MAFEKIHQVHKSFRLTIDKEIHVRIFHPDDAEELFMLLERNRERLRPWIHPSALPDTLKATRIYTIECFFYALDDPSDALLYDYFDELDCYFSPDNRPLEMGIWMNGCLAGEITLTRLMDSCTAVEFGYWLTEEMVGRGIISRCVGALMDHAVAQMGIERFIIGCAINNLRSRAIPERLGYRLQATIPNGEIVGENIYDRVIYGIRSDDWRERRNTN
jgi:ribosomal-protein-serine acetyltransferase